MKKVVVYYPSINKFKIQTASEIVFRVEGLAKKGNISWDDFCIKAPTFNLKIGLEIDRLFKDNEFHLLERVKNLKFKVNIRAYDLGVIRYFADMLVSIIISNNNLNSYALKMLKIFNPDRFIIKYPPNDNLENLKTSVPLELPLVSRLELMSSRRNLNEGVLINKETNTKLHVSKDEYGSYIFGDYYYQGNFKKYKNMEIDYYLVDTPYEYLVNGFTKIQDEDLSFLRKNYDLDYDGKVLSSLTTEFIIINTNVNINFGDNLQFITPEGRYIRIIVDKLWNLFGEKLTSIKAYQIGMIKWVKGITPGTFFKII